MWKKRTCLSLPGIAVGALVLLAGAAEVAAQATNGRRIYQEQLRVALDQQAPGAGQAGLDGGGWFSFALFKYDDPPGRRYRTLRQFDLRLWGSMDLFGPHRFYVRGRVGWEDWNSGDNPGDVSGDVYNDPEVERAWYELNVSRLLLQAGGEQPAFDFRVKVGRAFTEIGSALVLSRTLDLVKFDLSYANWDVMAFLGKTIRDSRNIDDSEPVARDSNRCLWGIQIAYTGLDRHRPYAYYLRNNDHINPDPDDPNQRYDYSSRYIGIGSGGTLLTPRMSYQTELVGELGRTYSEGVTDGSRDEICAMAYDLQVAYQFDGPMSPKIMGEYLFASGDSDRRLSSTSTIGGNLAGTRDNAFNAFGFRDTGVAFAPRISNLNMYMLGGSLFPLQGIELFRRFEVGTKVFFYHKSTRGPISDTDAAGNNSRWLGWEWDVYFNWRVTSDLSLTVRYGAFQPGAAFGNDDCRQFLYTALTFSF